MNRTTKYCASTARSGTDDSLSMGWKVARGRHNTPLRTNHRDHSSMGTIKRRHSEAKKGVKLISICILDKGHSKNLKHRLPSIDDKRCEIILISNTPPDEHGFIESLNRGVLSIIHDADPTTAAHKAVQQAEGEWILILRTDEDLTPGGVRTLFDLCSESREDAYYLLIRKAPTAINRNFDLSEYEWVGNRGKFDAEAVRIHSYITSPEVRLFKKNRFDCFLPGSNGSLTPVLKKPHTTLPVAVIRLDSIDSDNSSLTEKTEQVKSMEDSHTFIAEQVEDPSHYYDFQFLAPDNISYSLIDEKDYPGLAAGLEMGLGSTYLLKFMILAFIKRNSFQKAIDFADRMIEKRVDDLEIWRLKAAAHFYQLDLSAAEKSYKKALSIKDDDADILFNLAKVYFIAKKFDTARSILESLTAYDEKSGEVSFLLRSLEDRDEKTAKLSLVMLSKDEEPYLGRALASVKDLVDEIVLVDTGSTDRTTSIAEKFGARVIDYTWNDDFAEARNTGLAHVTGDYVLWMDADEFIDNDVKIALLVFKSILPLRRKQGFVFEIRTFGHEQDILKAIPPQGVTTRTAIFPVLPDIHFSGRIAESVDEFLKRHAIERIFAENTYFIHVSGNTDMRIRRKTAAFEKSPVHTMNPGTIFKGVFHFLAVGDMHKAGKWFEQAIIKTGDTKRHDNTIYYVARTLDHRGHLTVTASPFHALLQHRRKSYRIMSFCAHMLYRAGFYDDAGALFSKLVYRDDNAFYDRPQEQTVRRNTSYLALSLLESDHFEECDPTIARLNADEAMRDTVQALVFYSEIRKGDIERAIAVLDSWIRLRRLSINETITGFADLLGIITRMTAIMSSYGQADATHILSRSAHHLARTL